MSEFDDLIGVPSPLPRRKQSEKAIQNEILVAVSQQPGALVWRNNTGQAWQGQRLRLPVGQKFEMLPGMVVLAEARPVDFGCPGSPDIIGSVKGRAVGIEVKADGGYQSRLQKRFEAAWSGTGALYGCAKSVAEALGIIDRSR
ncbi:hypothetical protein [Sphingopyxis sp. GW247-27LB]|uniref:hypothetical protein n=1 Tax=Sphingopyxis sp. GW247-27LB TaxID=2012632 RepID=UPI000BA6570D|nr:hypothetical protein [Sphingopyxis sp. GW247-27LB]PAL23599.1 hypothetical protein CD928_05900 [Sphingopyxis sp. GW247-27LB]